jgi:hypothetical protein
VPADLHPDVGVGLEVADENSARTGGFTANFCIARTTRLFVELTPTSKPAAGIRARRRTAPI